MRGGFAGLLIFLAVLITAGILAFGWYYANYNRAIDLDEIVDGAWAQVENQLQRRNDLIPNLVETVKGYASQEKEIFTEVARLRSQWAQSKSVEEKIATANEMSGVLSRLLVVTENYPQLKSNENFLLLQSQLEGTENRIAVERMRYNEAVQNFNRFRRSFFGRYFAQAAGVEEAGAYFKAEEKAKAVPEVRF